MADDDQEKTEEPTQKRIDDARKKGQVAFSKEVTNALLFGFLALVVLWLAPMVMKQAHFYLSGFLTNPHDRIINGGAMLEIMRELIVQFLTFMGLPVLLVMIIAVASNFMQNSIIFSAESITPKLEKISPIKGVKRLFSLKSFMEFVKGLFKITAVGISSYLVIDSYIPKMEVLVDDSIAALLVFITKITFKIVLSAALIMVLIAALDFAYQKFEYAKSLRMSKQDLKEEYKQMEGDPHIKGRLRQIRMERARKRMMAAVPDADVIIRNPTHYAVALKYDEAVMSAPKVTALGQGSVAERIIEVAQQHDVPTVQNPPLARALFDSAELDEEIPIEHYKAVAEIISYIYSMRS